MSSTQETHVGLKFLVSIPLTIIQIIWGGFVIMTLWNWFVPLIFDGAPTLSFALAIGLDLVVSALMMRRVAATSEKETLGQTMANTFAYAIISGLVLLIVGFFVVLFI